MKIPPFHLAIPVSSISKSMEFYGKLLGCQEGRRCKKGSWVDYNFFGHQLVCHFTSENFKPIDHFNPVDGD
jgi:extradiol dioxygenase family protein